MHLWLFGVLMIAFHKFSKASNMTDVLKADDQTNLRSNTPES